MSKKVYTRDMSESDMDIRQIIYEEQFKVRLFFPMLIFTRVGIASLAILTFFYGISIDTIALMIVVLYAYSKYENIKRNELHSLFLLNFISALWNRGKK